MFNIAARILSLSRESQPVNACLLTHPVGPQLPHEHAVPHVRRVLGERDDVVALLLLRDLLHSHKADGSGRRPTRSVSQGAPLLTVLLHV